MQFKLWKDYWKNKLYKESQMSVESVLKREGIEVVSQIDTLAINTIAQNIARRIVETFPNFNLSENDIFSKLAKLNMYKAKMIDGMAEANYFYRNISIYFNENIHDDDLEEFAIHECLHYLQERKDDNNNLIRMGLCNYDKSTPIGLGLNEAAVQYTASWIIGVEADYEKYYDISLYTPSPSYYPLECSLLNEILYFTGNDVLFRSTLFSNDDFKNLIIEKTSDKVYEQIQNYFDKIIDIEEHIIKINSKIDKLENGSPKYKRLSAKLNKVKHKMASAYINTQNLIIKSFFDGEFEKIINLEDIDNYRRKLYKFSDIIGHIKNYKFFENYYIEMMNKLEHKSNILENGGTETALATSSNNSILKILQKLWSLITKKENSKDNIY